MKLYYVFLTLICFTFCVHAQVNKGIHKNLVDLATLSSSIEIDIKYAYKDNFVGTRIDGYLSNKCYLSKPAAHNLLKQWDTK